MQTISLKSRGITQGALQNSLRLGTDILFELLVKIMGISGGKEMPSRLSDFWKPVCSLGQVARGSHLCTLEGPPIDSLMYISNRLSYLLGSGDNIYT
jgi:hypothetical protein